MKAKLMYVSEISRNKKNKEKRRDCKKKIYLRE